MIHISFSDDKMENKDCRDDRPYFFYIFLYKNLHMSKIIINFALQTKRVWGLTLEIVVGEYTPSRTYMNIIKIF